MLETMWVLLFIFAILLIILAIEYMDYQPYWGLVFITLDIILWGILALSQMKIEQPYAIYNSSSGAIETGIHVVTSSVSPFLTYIFSGISLCLMIYLLVSVFTMFKK